MTTVSRRQFVFAAPAIISGRPPNILFLFPDQHRFDWTSANRALGLKTPHFDRLRQRGVLFTRAIVPSPLCAPSRTCLASGREYHRAGVRNNRHDYPLAQPTFYQGLRERGYHVAGCGKFDLHKGTQDWGLDGTRLIKEWGFTDGIDNAGKGDAIASGAVAPKDPYMAYLHTRGFVGEHVADFRKRAGKLAYARTEPAPLPDDAYCDNWVGANALKLLARAPRSKPWFLQVNFTGPHPPMDITRSMERLARGRAFPQPHKNTQFEPGVHTAIRQNYSVMIENIDRRIGEILDAVERRGELDNTLVVLSSDHGEMLGDRDLWGKRVPYQPSIGVPLVVAGPGVREGRVSGALVSTIDLAATFLEAAGIPPLKDADSVSLWPILEARQKEHRQCLVCGLDEWRLAWDGRFKLVDGYGAEPALYDTLEDPGEDLNLIAERPNAARRMRLLLPPGFGRRQENGLLGPGWPHPMEPGEQGSHSSVTSAIVEQAFCPSRGFPQSRTRSNQASDCGPAAARIAAQTRKRA